MLARVLSRAIVGLSAEPVSVEVDVADGLPGVTIVGLPDASVKESKDRIRSALRNTGFAWPPTRVTVSLAPADLKKEGSAFDFPIALGLLAASGQLPAESFSDAVALGELALDGTLRKVSGALSVAISMQGSGKRLLLPEANAAEAALVPGVRVFPLKHLYQAVRFLAGEEPLAEFRADPAVLAATVPADAADLSEIKGQQLAKRAVEIAAAGGHNLLLVGPPGSGKTMLAQRIPTILPPMSLDEAVETTQVYSVMGLSSPESPLITARPFRAPHHTVSDAGLIGGGSMPRPGEMSLAHHGVLYLDELPEFSRRALESLRQPLEEGSVTVSRASGTLSFPARCMLVASMNPCPCGFAGEPSRGCTCAPAQILRYRARVSGPLLDRIDMHVEIPAVSFSELSGAEGEPSSAVRARVAAARQVQLKRFAGVPSVYCNAQMRYRQLKAHCRLEADARELLRLALAKLGLSARAYDRVLKVSRTIADLAGSERVLIEHVAEAVQYRALDRSRWEAMPARQPALPHR